MKTVLFTIFFLTSTAAWAQPEALVDLRGRRGSLPEGEEISLKSLRPQAQKEAALSASIKAGARWRYERIVEELILPHAYELDKLFNFQPLMIVQGEVMAMPPIIVRAGPAIRLDDLGLASVQTKSYKFLRSARIVTTPPNWRNYLLQELPAAEELHSSIMPLDGAEAALWRSHVDEGWLLGVKQADSIFESNVNRLVRDFKGALIYYALSSEGLVEKPVIKVTQTGTQIMAKEVIYDRTIYQMTRDGNFQKKPSPRKRSSKKSTNDGTAKPNIIVKPAPKPTNYTKYPCGVSSADLGC